MKALATAIRQSAVRQESAAAPSQCSCRQPESGSNQAIQTRLRIGRSDDPLEREADRIADAVLAGELAGPLSPARATTAQRKCAVCEEEEEHEDLRRKEAGATSPVGDAGAAAGAATAVHNGGSPMPADLRSYLEPRFRRDLSEVRLHTRPEAARAARAINARAFTLGRDIAFAPGEYRPEDEAGRHLIAHELAHVAQQAGGEGRQVIRRQGGGAFHERRFSERAGGGTTDFVETVRSQPTAGDDGRITGRIRRSEIAPAVGEQPEQEISSGTVDVLFDPNTCTVELPYRINFVAAARAGADGICAEPAPDQAVENVSAARVAEIGDEVVEIMNENLRGWYSLRIEGCEHDCAGQEIEIVPNVVRSADSPDTTIDVVNRGGRADAGTICARDFNPRTTVHEGGHQVLELGDEYRETDAALRQRVPDWARDERVRSDMSIMGEHHAAGRFALFHERHFRFAQVFMEAVLRDQDCTVEMEAEPRWTPDFRISGFIGGVGTNVGAMGAFGGGIDMSLWSTRERELELFVGAHALYLTGSQEYRGLFLLGARLGLRAQTSPGRIGVVGEVFGEAGGSFPLGSQYGREPLGPESPAPYVAGGAGLRLRSSMLGSGVRLDVGAELLIGTELRRDELPALMADQAARSWFGAGLNLGLAF